MLTLQTAVNELISLNLHLSSFTDDGQGYQSFRFEQDSDEDSFEVIVTFFDGEIQFVDFVGHVDEIADTWALYSSVNHRHMTDEEARKHLREQFYSFVSSDYERRAEKLAKLNS